MVTVGTRVLKSNRVLMADLLSNFKASVINGKIKTVTLSVRYTAGLFDTLRPFPDSKLKKSQDEVTVETR